GRPVAFEGPAVITRGEGSRLIEPKSHTLLGVHRSSHHVQLVNSTAARTPHGGSSCWDVMPPVILHWIHRASPLGHSTHCSAIDDASTTRSSSVMRQPEAEISSR